LHPYRQRSKLVVERDDESPQVIEPTPCSPNLLWSGFVLMAAKEPVLLRSFDQFHIIYRVGQAILKGCAWWHPSSLKPWQALLLL
jgi:hypothetical protein